MKSSNRKKIFRECLKETADTLGISINLVSTLLEPKINRFIEPLEKGYFLFPHTIEWIDSEICGLGCNDTEIGFIFRTRKEAVKARNIARKYKDLLYPSLKPLETYFDRIFQDFDFFEKKISGKLLNDMAFLSKKESEGSLKKVTSEGSTSSLLRYNPQESYFCWVAYVLFEMAKYERNRRYVENLIRESKIQGPGSRDPQLGMRINHEIDFVRERDRNPNPMYTFRKYIRRSFDIEFLIGPTEVIEDYLKNEESKNKEGIMMFQKAITGIDVDQIPYRSGCLYLKEDGEIGISDNPIPFWKSRDFQKEMTNSKGVRNQTHLSVGVIRKNNYFD